MSKTTVDEKMEVDEKKSLTADKTQKRGASPAPAEDQKKSKKVWIDLLFVPV